MATELISINLNQIIVTPGVVQFDEFEKLHHEALQLAAQIEQVTVSDENIQYSKKLLAAVNKRVKEMEDKRISIKKEILEPYDHFEQQVKEIVSIVKNADNTVRNQVRELEEIEREEKRSIVAALFEKRIKHYTFGEMYTFDKFLKPTHLNKSTTLKTVELEMVEWLESIDADLKVINNLPDSEAVLAEYYDTKNLTIAMNIVSDREAHKQRLTEMFTSTKKSDTHFYTITLTDDKDLTAVELFMKLNKIKFTIAKVEN